MGTCGGLQYAVVEYSRNVLGRRATHAETDGVDDDNVVAPLGVLAPGGEERLATPAPGSRFADWVDAPFAGRHFCSYAPTAQVVRDLEAAGVVVGATAPDAGAEVLEFPAHSLYVASLFQPHVGASRGEPDPPIDPGVPGGRSVTSGAASPLTSLEAANGRRPFSTGARRGEGRRGAMGVEIKIEGLTKSFGKQLIWDDVTLTLPPARSA